MNNILYQSLPTEWEGYEVNTGFHIGVQISLLMDDETVNERLKMQILCTLLFGNEDGSVREMPETQEELDECVGWFLGGWHHDNTPKSKNDDEKIMDYDIDQGRIYADFMRFYGIDLEFTSMHYWKFCWLLWNLPSESSFHQAIRIRTEKPRKGASAEERKAILQGKEIYGLKKKKAKPKYNKEEIDKIDAFDRFMENINKNKGQ